MSDLLIERVRALLRSAREPLAGTAGAATLDRLADRLDEPLRVAIAGRVKAGKSTLLNALVGDELAPTDAGECTRIVTWYRDDVTYRVILNPLRGDPRPASFQRDGGPIRIDLEGLSPEEVEELHVSWPSSSLREMTLIDTPGIAAASVDAAERARRFLASEEGRVTEADAVVYLMRHLHGSDVRFLEAFHDRELAEPVPVNTVGVLSRADEIAGGRLDGMASAVRIAARYRSDERIRRLCQTVVPVAGLLAQAGFTLTEREFGTLRAVAGLADEEIAPLLLSVDRFGGSAGSAIPATERRRLLERLGLFGVRVSAYLIRRGEAATAPKLAGRLQELSGIHGLRDVLTRQLTERRDVLKARAAIEALKIIIDEANLPADHPVRSELERTEAGAHEFAEVRLINALRAGAVPLEDEQVAEAERLLGGAGGGAAERLGLPSDAGPDDIREATTGALSRWQAIAASPLAHREAADAARTVVRSCERILADLGQGPEV